MTDEFVTAEDLGPSANRDEDGVAVRTAKTQEELAPVCPGFPTDSDIAPLVDSVGDVVESLDEFETRRVNAEL